GRTEAPDIGSNLTKQLLVGTTQYNFSLARRLSRYTRRQRILDRMGKAQRQADGTPLCLSAVTNAHKLELSLKTLAHANYHIIYQCAKSTGHRPRLLRLSCRLDFRKSRVHYHLNQRIKLNLKFALGTLNR